MAQAKSNAWNKLYHYIETERHVHKKYKKEQSPQGNMKSLWKAMFKAANLAYAYHTFHVSNYRWQKKTDILSELMEYANWSAA